MNFWLIISIVAIAGCKETENLVQNREGADMSYSLSQGLSLKELIGEESHEILSHPDSIKISKIEPVAVEGESEEFGRKTKLVKSWKADSLGFSTIVLKDENYTKIGEEEEFDFDPNLQFELKREEKKLSLMLDDKAGILGFMTLEGQIVLRISEGLEKELMEMSTGEK